MLKFAKYILLPISLIAFLVCGCVSSKNVPHIRVYGLYGEKAFQNIGVAVNEDYIVKYVVDDEGNYLVKSDTLKKGTYVIDVSDVDVFTKGEYEIIITAMSNDGTVRTATDKIVVGIR